MYQLCQQLFMKIHRTVVFKTRKYFGPIKLQKLQIKLLDEYGKVVNLNNADISITFEIESLDMPYKKRIE